MTKPSLHLRLLILVILIVLAATVKIQVVNGGTWYSCTNTAGSVSCDTTAGTQATVAPADQLTVVATT